MMFLSRQILYKFCLAFLITVLAFVSGVCEEICWRQKAYGSINIKKGDVTEEEIIKIRQLKI